MSLILATLLLIAPVWAVLPARGKERPPQVVLADRATLARAVPRLRGVVGYYVPGRIVVTRDRPAIAGEVFAHEWGHHVWTLLTPAERREWRSYWRAHLDRMPRAYSRTSAEEGWADAFVCTYLPGVGEPFRALDAETRAMVRRFFP